MNTQTQNQNRQTSQIRKFEEMFIDASWRRTGMGAITHPIALKAVGNKLILVRPMRKEFSRSGNHGRFYYLRDEVEVLLYLEQSNSGKRSVILSICRLPQELCSRITDVAEALWVGFDTYYTADVEKALTLLHL
ncbi:MAG: hypothetical protein ACO2PN_24135 [Pyrobaculum sp.]|jgi:hypothetical protein